MGNVLFDLHLREWRRSLRCCLDVHHVDMYISCKCIGKCAWHNDKRWGIRSAHVEGNVLFALSMRQCREPLHFTVYRSNPNGYD